MDNQEFIIDINIKENICGKIDNWLSKTNDYSPTSFANMLGVSFTSVKRWRRRICLPDVSLLPKICEIMKISLYELFGIDDPLNLSEMDKQIIQNYHYDISFKRFIDKYLNDESFKTSINTLIKFSE